VRPDRGAEAVADAVRVGLPGPLSALRFILPHCFHGAAVEDEQDGEGDDGRSGHDDVEVPRHGGNGSSGGGGGQRLIKFASEPNAEEGAMVSRETLAVVIAYAPWVLVLAVFWWVLERGQRKG
jgi:hypothetical protein